MHGLHEEQVKQIKRALATGLFHPSELGVFSACFPALARTHIYSYTLGAYTGIASAMWRIYSLHVCSPSALLRIMHLKNVARYSSALMHALHFSLWHWRNSLFSCFMFARECVCSSRCMQCAQNYFALSSKCTTCVVCSFVCSNVHASNLMFTCADTKTASRISALYKGRWWKNLSWNQFAPERKFSNFTRKRWDEPRKLG